MKQPTLKPILNWSLQEIMRSEIASTLGQVMQIYTVGHFLHAWQNPKVQKKIEQMFDTPEQARQAVATCAAWLGAPGFALHQAPDAWWIADRKNEIQ